jgi:hypothetical protein
VRVMDSSSCDPQIIRWMIIAALIITGAGVSELGLIV